MLSDKMTKMVCRYDEVTDELKFTPLDGSINARCIPGNTFLGKQ